MMKNRVLLYAFLWSITAHALLLFCFRIKMFDIPELEPLDPISVLLEKEGIEVIQADTEQNDDMYQTLLSEALIDSSWLEYRFESTRKQVHESLQDPIISMNPGPFFPISEQIVLQSTPDFMLESIND